LLIQVRFDAPLGVCVGFGAAAEVGVLLFTQMHGVRTIWRFCQQAMTSPVRRCSTRSLALRRRGFLQRNLIMLAEPADGVVVGHHTRLDKAQNRGQLLILAQAAMRIGPASWLAPEAAVPFRQIDLFEKTVGLLQARRAGSP
jgi:hypothetical protein